MSIGIVSVELLIVEIAPKSFWSGEFKIGTDLGVT